MRKIINGYSIQDLVNEARQLYKKKKRSECPEVFSPGYDNDFRIQATATIIKGEYWGALIELEYQLIISSPIKSLIRLINQTLAEWSDEVSELIEDEPNKYDAL
ncbi:hypothetical protein DID88_001414 [Monilinia fructigena]|uniref:Uncharacterized protein n=1 Tax=Monilinia fructigena TaxID=38457 RepID=A0A395IWZ2_9HELO|nr:hypothetical protein DID88_001414 [Monilinia fructigena]